MKTSTVLVVCASVISASALFTLGRCIGTMLKRPRSSLSVSSTPPNENSVHGADNQHSSIGTHLASTGPSEVHERHAGSFTTQPTADSELPTRTSPIGDNGGEDLTGLSNHSLKHDKQNTQGEEQALAVKSHWATGNSARREGRRVELFPPRSLVSVASGWLSAVHVPRDFLAPGPSRLVAGLSKGNLTNQFNPRTAATDLLVHAATSGDPWLCYTSLLSARLHHVKVRWVARAMRKKKKNDFLISTAFLACLSAGALMY